MVFDEALREAAEGDGPLALVSLARVSGSTPRETGSRMAVLADGGILGTVGGGRPEGEAREAALALLSAKAADPASPSTATLHVEMTGASATGVDLICGGVADIWIEVVGDRARAACRAALEAIGRGESVVLVSSAEEGTLGAADGRFDDAAAARALAERGCALNEADGLLYSCIEPPERLLILGGGHVGLALARAATLLSFEVSIADPRPEYSDPARFPAGIACIRADFAAAIAAFPAGERSYAVVVSPGHLGDLECARALLERDWRYIGLIGSRRKSRMLLDQLAADGYEELRIDAIRCPIGLDIGALTPEEIAVAIAAELIAVRHSSPALAWIDADRKRRRSEAR